MHCQCHKWTFPSGLVRCGCASLATQWNVGLDIQYDKITHRHAALPTPSQKFKRQNIENRYPCQEEIEVTKNAPPSPLFPV